MRPCRWITWLLLPLAALGSRLVLADGVQLPSGPLEPEQASILSAGHWAPVAPLPLAPMPEPVLVEPEAAEPEILPTPPEVESRPAALTLDELEQIALESNPTLVQARMGVQAAQGGYVQAGLYPNPAIGYAGGDMGIEGTSGQQGAVFSQEIVTSRKLRLGRAVASHEVQQARHGWEAQRWRVLNDVRGGYYKVLLAQEMIDLNQQLVDIGGQGVNVTEQLRAREEVSQIDVLQAGIEAETAKLSLVEAENYHRGAWRRLAAMLGRPEMEPAPLAGDVEMNLPNFNWEDTLSRLLAQSPELAQARAGVQRARSEVTLQCAERVPNIEIGLGAKYDASVRNTLADVELSLPLPLFNRNQGNIIKAQAGLVAAQKEVERIELDLRDRLAAAFAEYATAQRQVETYTSTIRPHAEKALELTRAGYRLGEFGYLTLLTAQRTYFSASLDYLAYLRELWARSVELEGMLLSGGLQGPE